MLLFSRYSNTYTYKDYSDNRTKRGQRRQSAVSETSSLFATITHLHLVRICCNSRRRRRRLRCQAPRASLLLLGQRTRAVHERRNVHRLHARRPDEALVRRHRQRALAQPERKDAHRARLDLAAELQPIQAGGRQLGVAEVGLDADALHQLGGALEFAGAAEQAADVPERGGRRLAADELLACAKEETGKSHLISI